MRVSRLCSILSPDFRPVIKISQRTSPQHIKFLTDKQWLYHLKLHDIIIIIILFKQITIVNSINIHRNIIVYFVIIGLGIHRFKNGPSIVWLDRYEVIRIREKKILQNLLQISYSIVDPAKFVFVMWMIICTTLKFSNQLIISSKGKSHKTFNSWQIWLRSI